jgi:pimeloyl-ACP methyl ester carboxylesterase
MTSATVSDNSITFLIVPGAWHTPWHYSILVSSLRALDCRVVCLANPSTHVDSRYPETGEDDATNIASAIRAEAKLGRKVILVMHSYGGAPGSEACKGLLVQDYQAEGQRGGVRKAVYIAAVVFAEGEEISEEMKAQLNLVIHVRTSKLFPSKLLPL